MDDRARRGARRRHRTKPGSFDEETPMTEAEFRAEMAIRGGQPNLVELPAEYFKEEHSHDFTARGLVLAGEFTLSFAGAAHHLVAGADFELAAGIPHTERTGATGARLLAARFTP